MGHHRVAALVMAAGLLMAALVAPGTSTAFPRQVGQDGADSSLKGQFDEIIGQEAAVVSRYQQAQARRARTTGELDRLRVDLKKSQIDLFAAQDALLAAEKIQTRQAVLRARADRKVADAEERLRQQIVASYVKGGEASGMLEALLNAANGQEAGQAVAFSRAIVGDSEKLVHELEAARAERRRVERVAKRARARAETRRDKVVEASTFIAAATTRQAKLVDQVNLQVNAEQAALREVQSRKAVIEGRINSINRSSDGVQLILAQLQAGQPDWAPGDVEITDPIPGYQIGSQFGMRRHPILGIVRLHAGGDLGAPSGTTIYAPADGVVIIAGVRGGYGNTTVIDHGYSLATLYGHQSQILVKAGQAVKRGDPIGKVGSTGLSTGSHLHFETRVKGVPIDPEGVVDFTRPEGSYAEEAAKLVAASGN